MILYIHKRIECNGDSHVAKKHCYEQTKGFRKSNKSLIAISLKSFLFNFSRATFRLRKGPATKSDEFSEKCHTRGAGGGGHFKSKNRYCRFWGL